MKVAIDWDGYEPIREHATDAGLDLRAKHAGVVPPHGSMTFGTGVHVQLPEGTAGVLLPKSGLMVNRDILTFGLVDQGYDGEVMVKMFNLGDNEYIVRPGNKISQMIIVPVVYENVEVVDKISGGERGSKGFGSTGL